MNTILCYLLLQVTYLTHQQDATNKMNQINYGIKDMSQNIIQNMSENIRRNNVSNNHTLMLIKFNQKQSVFK